MRGFRSLQSQHGQSPRSSPTATKSGGASGCPRGMRIGLTGGMGCGKSTVGSMLEKRGMRRLDADVIVKELLTSDEGTKRAVLARWGAAVDQSDGNIDRTKLAAVVFADPQQLKELENLLHPRVAMVREQRIAEHPEADWVVEIPLLFEKNLETQFDSVIAVYVREDERVQRLLRKGFSVDMIQRRSQNQWSVIRKAELADYVLLNQGSLEFLEEQVSLLRYWLDQTASNR